MPAAWSGVMARCPSCLHPPLPLSRTKRPMLAQTEPGLCDRRCLRTTLAFSRPTALILLHPTTEVLRTDAVHRGDGRAYPRHSPGSRRVVVRACIRRCCCPERRGRCWRSLNPSRVTGGGVEQLRNAHAPGRCSCFNQPARRSTQTLYAAATSEHARGTVPGKWRVVFHACIRRCCCLEPRGRCWRRRTPAVRLAVAPHGRSVLTPNLADDAASHQGDSRRR